MMIAKKEGRKEERRADERSADVERLIPRQLGGKGSFFRGKFNNERKDPERQKKVDAMRSHFYSPRAQLIYQEEQKLNLGARR